MMLHALHFPKTSGESDCAYRGLFSPSGQAEFISPFTGCHCEDGSGEGKRQKRLGNQRLEAVSTDLWLTSDKPGR